MVCVETRGVEDEKDDGRCIRPGEGRERGSDEGENDKIYEGSRDDEEDEWLFFFSSLRVNPPSLKGCPKP